MAKKDEVEGIQDRLKRAETSLEPYKDKIHRLRTIALGDPRALIAKGASDDQTEGDVKRAYSSNWPDIFVKDIEEGRSNKILRAVRTLGQQTTHQFPEIEAEGLDFEEANLHAEYFRQRLGPPPLGCDAVIHMRRALYDYLVGGFGWVWIAMKFGKPIVQYMDTLDCKWDQQSPTVGEGTWWSCSMYASLKKWEALFGKGKFDQFIKEKNAKPDTPLELEYYYDTEGSEGRWKVLFKTGSEDIDMKPVFESTNPCFWDYGGQKVPFLPAECMFFMEMPGARLPFGLVEQMLPSQIALWRSERSIRRIVDNPAFYDIEEESYDPKQLQAFEDGKTGGFLMRKQGKPPVAQMPAMDVPNNLMQWQNQHNQEIVAQGGADPYAGGAPVEGTNFAREVEAIKASTGLMSGSIGKENDAFWLRMLVKFLAKGSTADDWPLVTRHEDVALVFNEQDPIRQYLRPDAKFTIREGSAQFMDKMTKMQIAKARLDTAIAVNSATGGAYVNAIKEEYNNFLSVNGERNLDKYEPVAPQPAPAGPTAPVTAPV